MLYGFFLPTESLTPAERKATTAVRLESTEKAELRGSESVKGAAKHAFIKGSPRAADAPEFLSTWTEEQETKTCRVRQADKVENWGRCGGMQSQKAWAGELRGFNRCWQGSECEL